MNQNISGSGMISSHHRRYESIRCGCLVICVGIVISIWLQMPYFKDPWLVQNDLRIHVWWMEKFRNENLFQNDALADMMEIKSWRSPGFLWLFKTAALIAEPVTISKVLSVILLPVTLLLIYLFGYTLAGSPAGLIAAALYLGQSMQSWDHGIVVLDGLQRSFRDPLLMTGLYGLALNNKKIMLVSIFLSVLFYPFAALLILGAIFIKYIVFGGSGSEKFMFQKKIVLLGLLLICLVGLTGIAACYLDKPFYGYTGSVFHNPRFSTFGREPIFQETGHTLGIPNYFFVGKSGGLLGFHDKEAGNMALFLWITICLIPGARIRSPHPILKSFLLSGCFFFLSSWIVAIVSGHFLLYFPSRYNNVSLFLVAWTGMLVSHSRKSSIPIRLIWITGMAVPIICFYHSGQYPAVWSCVVFAIIGLLPDSVRITGRVTPILFVSAFYLPLITHVEKTPGAVSPEPWEKQLISIMKQMDESVMIAGPPDLMNNIPIHARRSVYLSFEMDTEMREDWARKRFMTFFDAYFADDPVQINKFAKNEGVDLMLVDRRMFEPGFLNSCAAGINRIYLEPHSKWIVNRIRDRGPFILADPPEDSIEFRYGPLVLVNLGKVSL